MKFFETLFPPRLIPKNVQVVIVGFMLVVCFLAFWTTQPMPTEVGVALLNTVRICILAVGSILAITACKLLPQQRFKTVEEYKSQMAGVPMITCNLLLLAFFATLYLIDFAKPFMQQSWGGLPITVSTRILWFEQRAVLAFFFLIFLTLLVHVLELSKFESKTQPSTMYKT